MKDLLFCEFSTTKKQILRRCAPQNDIATQFPGPQAELLTQNSNSEPDFAVAIARHIGFWWFLRRPVSRFAKTYAPSC